MEPAAATAAAAAPTVSVSAGKRDNTTPSCAVCQKRKVKCDRVFPCAPCRKTGLECTFRTPAPRQRSKRPRPSEHEDDAQPDRKSPLDGAAAAAAVVYHTPATSADREASEHTASPATAPTAPTLAPNTARLVSDGGGYRYVNNHLWSTLPTTNGPVSSPAATATSAATPNTRLGAQSGDSIYESVAQVLPRPTPSRSFIFGQTPSNSVPSHGRSSVLDGAQLQPAHIIQLWQTYLTNIDPIMKVFHAPTVQQVVLGQIGNTNITASDKALIASIYLISVVSLTDGECHRLLQEPRADLVARCRSFTEEALSAANFAVTTDITVLRALVLYLAAIRSLGDTLLVWSLNGVAIRVAGTIGLTRDGSHLNLPPFESEMRRRLLFALIYLDARTAEVVGQDGDLLVQKHDAHVPSNLNDSELYPSMSRLPDDRPAATEMVYVQLRATLSKRMRSGAGGAGPAGSWQRLGEPGVPKHDKADFLQGLERHFYDEILKYCDPSVPLQYLTLNTADAFISKMRLIAKIPVYPETVRRDPDDECSDNLYELSMHIMQLQLDLWTNPLTQRWRWHWSGHFHWYGLACLIRQTRLRNEAPDAMRGWNTIRNVFEVIIPTIEAGPQKSPILDAIQRLLHGATAPQDRRHSGHRGSLDRRSESLVLSPMHRDPTPMSFSTFRYNVPGTGAQPHSACLPGISNMGYPHQEQENGGHFNGLDDSAFWLDFNAIDWEEFDRLTNELGRK